MFQGNKDKRIEIENTDKKSSNVHVQDIQASFPYINQPQIARVDAVIAMKYNLPINNLMYINSNSSNVHNVPNINVHVQMGEQKQIDNVRKVTSGYIDEDQDTSTTESQRDGITRTEKGTPTDERNTGTSDEGTGEISSHPTNSNSNDINHGLQIENGYDKRRSKEKDIVAMPMNVSNTGGSADVMSPDGDNAAGYFGNVWVWVWYIIYIFSECTVNVTQIEYSMYNIFFYASYSDINVFHASYEPQDRLKNPTEVTLNQKSPL